MEGSIMLVLSRKVGESILISETIRVTVVQSAKNGRIRLGIDAPPEVIVLREELTKSCFNSSPSKNGAEARPPSASCPEHTASASFARATPPDPTARDRQRSGPDDVCPVLPG